jgi:spore germination protein (amino acid permease)
VRPARQGEQTISARQLWLLIAASRTAAITTTLPVVTGAMAGRDAWIASLLATVLAVGFGLVVAAFARNLRRDSFAEYSRRVLGPHLGSAAALVLLAAFIGGAHFQARTFADLITLTALPKTPTWALGLITTFAPTFIAWRGLDGLGRAAEVGLTLLIISFAFLLPAVSAPEFEWQWVLPVLEHGWRPVVTAVPVALLWFMLLTSVSLAAYPHLDQPKRLPGALVVGNLVPGLILTAMAVVVVGQFGPGQAARMVSPVYVLVNSLRIGAVVRRLEILAVAIWVPAACLMTGLLIWAAARLLSGISRLQIRHGALLIGGLLLAAGALDSPDGYDLVRTTNSLAGPIALGGLVAPPAVVWAVSLVRRPRSGDRRKARRRTGGGGA